MKKIMKKPRYFWDVKKFHYIDDVFYGAAGRFCIVQAFKLKTQGRYVLEEARMNLPQFNTNSTELKKL